MKNGRYSIGEISKLCCIPISRLRYYDETGVIRPCYVDEESGYRYYDNETLLLISILKYYQNCGFKLKEIVNLLQRMDLAHLEPMFNAHIDALEEQITTLRIRRDSILAWRDLIYEEMAAMALPECPVTHRWYMRTVMYVSKPYVWEGMPYKILLANIESCNHITSNSDCTVGALSLYFPHSDRRDFADAKIYIRPHPLASPHITQETIPGFGTLACYHRGSLETVEETYEKIRRYAQAQDLPLRGDSFERSVIDWWSTQREEEFLMEVILPTTETSPSADAGHGLL